MTCKISGSWVIVRTCPFDGTESILGVFPQGKAALLKLEHFMDSPEDDEAYKIEYHVFRSVEHELEAIQRCKANRAEWDEKTRIYDNYKKEKEEQEELNEEYDEEHGYRALVSDT